MPSRLILSSCIVRFTSSCVAAPSRPPTIQLVSRKVCRAKAVPKFTSSRISDFAWSADGKQLLLARGDIGSDVVLLSHLR